MRPRAAAAVQLAHVLALHPAARGAPARSVGPPAPSTMIELAAAAPFGGDWTGWVLYAAAVGS